MTRRNKVHHYIYKTTCSLTKRYYYGMHSTDNLNDGYLGSGSNLSKSIKKYGKENHFKEIIEYVNDRPSLKKRESEIINENMLSDPLCMNLSKGGNGSDYTLGLVTVKDKNGNTLCCHKDDQRYLSGELVHISTGMVIVKDKNGNKFRCDKNDLRYLNGDLVGVTKNMPFYNKSNYRNKMSIILSGKESGFKNKNHSIYSKNKIGLANSKKQTGKNNSQYGTRWITNGVENKKIKKGEPIPDEWKLGRIMKIS